MASFAAKLIGASIVQNFFEELSDISNETWYVGTIVEYAARVHENHETNSKFIRNAVLEIREDVLGDTFDSFVEDHDIETAVQETALELEARAKERTPIDTGNLKASISAGPSLSEMRKQSETDLRNNFNQEDSDYGNPPESPDEILP